MRANSGLQCRDLAVGDVLEALREGAERLVLLWLARGGEGRQGAPVERSQGGDDDVAARAPDAAGQLEGAFVRLGAGIREEHLTVGRGAVPHEAVQVRGEALIELVVEQVGHVREAGGLTGDRVCDPLVGVAEGHDRDAGEEVEIPASLVVEQLCALPGHETDRCRRRTSP